MNTSILQNIMEGQTNRNQLKSTDENKQKWDKTDGGILEIFFHTAYYKV